jgi:hypothetical protein
MRGASSFVSCQGTLSAVSYQLSAGWRIAFHGCDLLIERSRQTKQDGTSSQEVRRRLKLN